MTYEMYRYVFLGGLIACGIFFVIALILFFTLRIPQVISDLSGRTARKAIESIRTQNEQSGDKTYQSSPVNLERGKLTDKISRSGKLQARGATPFGTGVITEKISTQKLEPASETEVLSAANETTLLSPEGGETELLSTDAGETSLLTAQTVPQSVQEPAQAFTLEYEITYIHTDEQIA